MEDYEDDVLERMYDKGLIGMRYTSTERVASKIKWSEIANRFGVKKSFKSVIRKLVNRGLVTDHGKGGKVASLTWKGVAYVKFIKEQRRRGLKQII